MWSALCVWARIIHFHLECCENVVECGFFLAAKLSGQPKLNEAVRPVAASAANWSQGAGAHTRRSHCEEAIFLPLKIQHILFVSPFLPYTYFPLWYLPSIPTHPLLLFPPPLPFSISISLILTLSHSPLPFSTSFSLPLSLSLSLVFSRHLGSLLSIHLDGGGNIYTLHHRGFVPKHKQIHIHTHTHTKQNCSFSGGSY